MPATPPIIHNPLRILLLAPPSTPLPPLLKEPTLPLSTPYYTATIPIWHDTIPTNSTSAPPSVTSPTPEEREEDYTDGIEQWEQEWLVPEAGEVVRALGAAVVAFRKPVSRGDLKVIRHLLTSTSHVLSHHLSSADAYAPSEPLLIAVGMPQPLTPRLEMGEEEWEEVGRECGGWEFVDGEIVGGEGQRNEFGEPLGLPRLLQALETCEWDALDPNNEASESFPFDDDDNDDGLDDVIKEAERDGRGLRRALLLGEREEGSGIDEDEGEGQDLQVEELERMMGRLKGVRDMGADMTEAQRKKLAAEAVRDIMKSL